jgi:hypothetical protein
MMRFELHAHTTRSDGLLTPSALVEYAALRGVAVLAVTDHDTVRGHREAIERGRELGIEVIPGIEITASAAGAEVHILGWFVDGGSRDLAAALARLRARRIERADAVLAKLRGLGVPVARSEVIAREAAMFGRPHIARAIVEAGGAANVDEAHRKFLGRGAPAHVPRVLMPSEEAIAAIRGAGGVAGLAHPARYDREPDLTSLRDQGLQAIEVYYPTHGPAEVARFEDAAKRLGLVATGGADFHADPQRQPDMGAQLVPPGALEDLRRAAGR